LGNVFIRQGLASPQKGRLKKYYDLYWCWIFLAMAITNQQLLVFIGGSSSAETTKEYIIRF
jgi:hypothetical protein